MSNKLETEKFIREFFGDIIKEAEDTSKITAAKKFKISISAVDSAYYSAGIFNKCSKSYLKRRQGIKTPFPKTWSPAFTPTWEQIIQVVPDKSVLAFLLIDGFTERIAFLTQENEKLKTKLSEEKQKYDALLEDRKRLMQEYNEYLSREKSGGRFTLDQTRHILIPKEK